MDGGTVCWSSLLMQSVIAVWNVIFLAVLYVRVFAAGASRSERSLRSSVFFTHSPAQSPHSLGHCSRLVRVLMVGAHLALHDLSVLNYLPVVRRLYNAGGRLLRAVREISHRCYNKGNSRGVIATARLPGGPQIFAAFQFRCRDSTYRPPLISSRLKLLTRSSDCAFEHSICAIAASLACLALLKLASSFQMAVCRLCCLAYVRTFVMPSCAESE